MLFPSRSQSFILNQIAGLIDLGHEVDVYANKKGDYENSHVGIDTSELVRRTYYFLNGGSGMPVNKLMRVAKGLHLLHQAWQIGETGLLRYLDIRKFGRNAASLDLFYKSRVFLQKQSYDIIHSHFGPNGQIGVALKDTGAIKGKVITTFYGYDVSTYVKKNGADVYKFLFSRGDLLIAISEKMKQDLTRLGCREDKILVHHLGVDVDFFGCHPWVPRKGDKVRILTVGRFVEKKGLRYGIQAIARLVKKFPQIEYTIIGDGELREELTQLISDLNVKDHVHLLGWKVPGEIKAHMEKSDIFLAPSITGRNGDQEGTPTVLLEALASSIPVISTFHSGIPELVRDGESGFLVPECDTDALVRKLELLLDHPEMWEGMGKAGRNWVEKHYNIHKLNTRLVEVYKSLL